jgi:CubicO group peptidase (beta-lactamase class C family)
MYTKALKFVAWSMAAAGLLSIAVGASAQAPTMPAPALTAGDAEAWLDGYMLHALQAGDVAGAVVVIVKDGEILVEKGYGYADVDKHVAVDPKHTFFRWGSTSKLFTWTAVMQLVEQGKINLDADVNQYLDFVIPAYGGMPVTMRNIMTHTAGFEERLTGLIGVESDGIVPLGEFLKRYVPARIFAPGATPAYSNYATALAGYIVARISGVSFDDYVDKHVLEPLAMSNSTFRQPLPERFKANLSKGYPAGSLPAQPFEIVGPAPAGALTSTGDDMAHFMIAHLQNGRYGASQILKAETAERMHHTALTIIPGINRMLLGFYEDNVNGHRVIAHGGDTQWFHSDLHLFIDDGVGLLVSLNSTGKDGAAEGIRNLLFHGFADRYWPAATVAASSLDARTAADHARMIAGRYAGSRRPETSFVSLVYMLSQTTVNDNGDGTIAVSTATSPSGVPLKWREIAPFLWRADANHDLLGAQVADGRIVRMSFGENSAIQMFDRVHWWQSAGFWLPLLALGLGALLLTSIAWPVSALTRRHYGASPPLSGSDAWALRGVRLACLGAATVFLAWTSLMLAMTSNLELISRLGGCVAPLLVVSAIVFPLAAALGYWNAWVVLRGGRTWYAKLWAVLLAVALSVMLWAAFAFHFISSRAGF